MDKELLVVLFKINIITASENIYLIFLSDCFIYICVVHYCFRVRFLLVCVYFFVHRCLVAL